MENVMPELVKLKGYKSLRKPQEEAIKQGLMENNSNYITIALTSIGKTFTADLAIYNTLKSGGRVNVLTLEELMHGITHILVTTFKRFFFDLLKNLIKFS